MTLNNTYRFFVTFDAVTTQVYPVNDSLSFSWEKEGDRPYKRENLSTEFVFRNNLRHADFDYFYAIEKSCDRCKPIDFKVQIIIAGVWYDRWIGRFDLNQVSSSGWNLDFCELRITPVLNDEYTCLEEGSDIEINILDKGIKSETINAFTGEVQYDIIRENAPAEPPEWILSSPYVVPPAATGLGWTLIRNRLEGVSIVPGSPPGVVLYRAELYVETTYAREFVAGAVQPPGDGWIAVTGGFARPLAATANYADSDSDPAGNSLLFIWDIPGLVLDGETGEYTIENYDNALRLGDVLNALLPCYEVTSNFFGIEPDGIYPSNAAYDYALAHYQELFVFQITDITNASAFNNATRAITKYSDFLADLEELFPEIQHKVINGKFVIEHYTYFRALETTGIDSTAYPETRGKRQYGYDNQRLPKTEKWEHTQKVSADFEAPAIIYPSNCVPKDNPEVKHIVRALLTDLYQVTTFPETFSNDGLFLMAAASFGGNYYILNSFILDTTEIKPNGSLSFKNLLDKLARWNRYQKTGNMNGEDVTFESTKPIRRQTPLSLKIDKQTEYDFDGNERIVSYLGTGQVDKASFNSLTRELVIELLFEVEC